MSELLSQLGESRFFRKKVDRYVNLHFFRAYRFHVTARCHKQNDHCNAGTNIGANVSIRYSQNAGSHRENLYRDEAKVLKGAARRESKQIDVRFHCFVGIYWWAPTKVGVNPYQHVNCKAVMLRYYYRGVVLDGIMVPYNETDEQPVWLLSMGKMLTVDVERMRNNLKYLRLQWTFILAGKLGISRPLSFHSTYHSHSDFQFEYSNIQKSACEKCSHFTIGKIVVKSVHLSRAKL